MQITRASLSNSSHKCEPIKPAPPVTRTFFFSKTTFSLFIEPLKMIIHEHTFYSISHLTIKRPHHDATGVLRTMGKKFTLQSAIKRENFHVRPAARPRAHHHILRAVKIPVNQRDA